MESIEDKILRFLSYGYGDGSGYGYGDGSGYGYGYGYGVSIFDGQAVYQIDDVATIIKHIKGAVAKGFILQNDFTLTPCYVVKGRGYFAHGETLKEAQDALEEKIFDDMDTDEKVRIFIQKFQIGTVYPAKDFYVWHNKLTGSCEMGRKAFARDHEIDIEKDSMTVEEFVKLTHNSFGGSVIRQIADELKIEF